MFRGRIICLSVSVMLVDPTPFALHKPASFCAITDSDQGSAAMTSASSASLTRHPSGTFSGGLCCPIQVKIWHDPHIIEGEQHPSTINPRLPHVKKGGSAKKWEYHG